MEEVGVPIEVQQSAESHNNRIILYKNNATEIFVPKKQSIPHNEGLQVKVSGEHDSTDTPRQVLARFNLGLGTAKVIAESGLTPEEPWANTRIENGQEISIYGRNAFNPDSWRKPADTLNREVPNRDMLSPTYDEKKLQALFKRYIPKWEKLGSVMELFPNGIQAQDIDNEDFSEYAVIWRSNSHTITIQKEPHLKGSHVIVHANQEMTRQWQTVRESPDDSAQERMVQKYIQATLEATAIAMGIQELIASKTGEIHNSGNWASGLKAVEDGGALSLENLAENPKKEKVKHRPNKETGKSDFGTSMHVHVYIPEDKGSPVVLPAMSEKEAGALKVDEVLKQWKEIPKASEDQIVNVKEKIGNGKLASWVEQNCMGKLLQAA